MNPYIADAIRAFTANPHVKNVRTHVHADGSGVTITADFDTRLPSTWRATGESPTGVRAVEEVEIYFSKNFPSSTPEVTLRQDFNPSLPHLNFHGPGQRVVPCIIQGDLLEAIHSDGIARLPVQIANWLENAGTDSLINPDQGWEPLRRLRSDNLLLLDSDLAVKNMPRLGGLQIYDISGFWHNDGAVSGAYAPKIRGRNTLFGNELRDVCEKLQVVGKYTTGKSLMAICWPARDFDGNCATYGKYMPDTVRTYDALLERSAEYGCSDALNLFTRHFNAAASDLPLKGHLPLYIVLAIRRPFALIGMNSEFELLVYRLEAPIPNAITTPSNQTVSAVAVLIPTTTNILRRTSALNELRDATKSTFVGCGSFGSKLMLHAARAGHAPNLLIDKAFFAPHNAARHSLHPFSAHKAETKAEQLGRVIAEYRDGIMPIALSQDVQDIPMHKYAEYFFESSSIVVNTTGSAMVRKFLSQSEMKARVIEASAMNSGEIGLFTLEGPERNPSTIDLVTYAYDLLRQSRLLEVADSLNPNLLQIGVGCNSVTLAISDAKLSLIAAGVGQKLLNIYENGLPVNGLASLAMVGEDGMSVCWAHHKVGPTQFANLTDTGGWNIRILESAHQKVIHDVEQNINVETGGLLVGRVSPLSREIIVTGILPAPPDSIRSKTEFILGVEGRANQISNYETAAKGVLWCIGTWHSHLGPFGPSTTDISTADILEGAIKGAALLLIRRPDGYSAVVRRGY